MAETTQIGNYTFSEDCVNCPYIRLAVEKKLAGMALFGPTLGPRNFEAFQKQLRDEVFEEITSTDGSLLGGGFFSHECNGATLEFNEDGKGFTSKCNREVIPWDFNEDENEDK